MVRAMRGADEPSKLAGLMLDAARLVETLEYYHRFLDFCQRWGANAVIFRLADDQGCSVRFRSHPELITHPNALEPHELRELARHAGRLGITLIPEIESFGHSRYITGTAEYSHLFDGPAGGVDFSALQPLHQASISVLSDLYAEACEVIEPEYIHIGCDEVDWGHSGYSQQLLCSRSRDVICAEHINALTAVIRRLGCETIIWGDMVLHHNPGILQHIDNRIILHDWQYETTSAKVVRAHLDAASAAGLRYVGGPALMWCKWGPRAGYEQLANIDAYCDACRNAYPDTYPDSCRDACPDVVCQVDNTGSLGIIVTNWVPSRYIRDAIWDGLAYACVAMRHGSLAARECALREFVESHFGSKWSSDWAEAFDILYRCAPLSRGVTRDGCAASDAECSQCSQCSRHLALLALLDGLVSVVRRNEADFAALRLSAEYIAHVSWRTNAMKGRNGDSPEAVLAEVALRDRLLAGAIRRDWSACRRSDSVSTAWGLEASDLLHTSFLQVAEASQSMAG